VSSSARTTLVLAMTGIVLVALGLRTGVAAVSPLSTRIDLDVPLQGLTLGILGTIPPVAYAVSAAVSPWFARKVGLEGAAIVVGLLGAIAHVWRGISPSYVSLFIATIVLMLAVGVGNVILPGLVKMYAPAHIAPLTAAYGTAMSFSSAAPTVLGVWIADEFGWRWSLATWAVVGILGIIPWLFLWPRAKAKGVQEAVITATLPIVTAPVSLFRSPTAVSIMSIFAVSGVMAYSWFAVLPPALMELSGISAEAAALALGLFTIMGFPMSLIVPALAVRKGWSGPLVGASMVANITGLLGLLFAPALAPFLWVTLLALGPLTFSMSLALISHRTRNHLSALILSGFVNKWGYLFAAAAPILVGLGREISGEWTSSILGLLALSLVSIPAMMILSQENNVDKELARHR
jgi:MFS transporter, CP family, cyanate transporter